MSFCKIFTCILSWTHAKTRVLEDSELRTRKETATQKSHWGNSGPIYQNGNKTFQSFEVGFFFFPSPWLIQSEAAL